MLGFRNYHFSSSEKSQVFRKPKLHQNSYKSEFLREHCEFSSLYILSSSIYEVLNPLLTYA